MSRQDWKIEIPQAFADHLGGALVRFRYLFADAEIQMEGNLAVIHGNEADGDLGAEFLHLVYREKVYSETLELRRALYDLNAP